MHLFLSHLIGGSAGSTILLSLAIIVSTIVLEDTTTVVVGLLAADGVLGVPFALTSLYAGIVLGDIGFYFLGRLASTSPRLKHYVDNDFIAPFRAWLETRFVLTVFAARFIPGSRLPTYTASGFFRSPLTTFILTAMAATSIWTTFLFSASYWFGNLTSDWLGAARWGTAGAFLLALFFIARHNLLRYRQKRDGLDSGADTRMTSGAGAQGQR